jgi:hypothetical protein
VGLPIPCSFILVAAMCLPFPAQDVPESMATYTPALALFPAMQTHMPTRHGDVSHVQPEEQIGPTTQPQIKVDPAQLQREARELLELSQSLQPDIESVNHGLLPKDTPEKLKRIQKLAKHLHGELVP